MKQLPDFSFITKLSPRAAVIAVIVLLVLGALAVRCSISEEEALKRYLELRERVSAKDKGKRWREVDDFLVRKINANPLLLQKKISRNVDKAIADYEQREKPLITMRSPIVLQEAKKLGGTGKLVLEQAIYYELDDGSMGIRGAWTKPWPNEIVTTMPGAEESF